MLPRIIVHPGSAHRDDFLSCCILIAKKAREYPILRRDPTQQDLDDPECFVVDCGCQFDPKLNNYDHHQFDRDHEPVCSLSLIIKSDPDLGDDFLNMFPWIKFTEIIDSKGPDAACEYLGLPINMFPAINNPVERYVLEWFGGQESVHVGSDLWYMMLLIGQDVLRRYQTIKAKLNFLQKKSTIEKIKDVDVIFAMERDPYSSPSFCLDLYKTKFHPTLGISVIPDEPQRGNGWCLYRFNNHPKVDFCRIKDDPRVMYSHKGGFVAKTKSAISKQEIVELLMLSIN